MSGLEDKDAAYLALLAKWNRSINLTALNIDPPDQRAISRLIDEPRGAVSFVSSRYRFAVDLGSGGGSPAIPLKNACPWLSFVLIESKLRKCAFLRAVVRELQLDDVRIENVRVENIEKLLPDLIGRADLVTFRAIRTGESFWECVFSLLKPGGRAIWFGGAVDSMPDRFGDVEVFGAGVTGLIRGGS